MLIPSEQLIIRALNHEIRCNILKLVHSRPYSYSELLTILRVTSGTLNYHLKPLTGFLVQQGENKLYSLSPLGMKAVEFLAYLSDSLTNDDIPNLCEAFSHHSRVSIQSLMIGLIWRYYEISNLLQII